MLHGLVACGAVACIALGMSEAAARLTRRVQSHPLLFAVAALEFAVIAGCIWLAYRLGDIEAVYGALLGAALGTFVIPYLLS